MDRIADVFAGLVTVALVTTIVSNRNTARIITATGRAFASATSAALGR